MKKSLKRFLAAIFAAALTLSFVACGGGSGSGGGKDGSDDPETLDIYYWSSGNGKEYMEKVIKAFQDENPDVKINFSPSSAVEGGDIYTDPENVTTDIYFTTQAFYLAHRQYLEPLNDVLDMVSDGVKVRNRLGEAFVESVTADDGKIYSLPWANSVSGFCYNETIFNEKGYKIPKTTDELTALCTLIVSDGLTPFIHYADYWNYPLFTWMAQYAGSEQFDKYWKGIYTTEEGEEKVNDIALFKDNVAKEKAIEVLPGLLSPKGFVYTGSNTLTHTTAQTYFLNGRGLMTPNGSWMENEMRNNLTGKYTFKMMKFPIVSSLGTKLGLEDEQLSAVVSYVDGDATAEETAYVETLSDDIVDRVRAARGIVYSERLQHSTLIPKISPAKELAKKFLSFYYSDKALEIAETTSGMMLPVNYSDNTTRKHPDSDSDFVRSCAEIYAGSSHIIERNYMVPLFYNGGIETFWHYKPVNNFTYISEKSSPKTYAQFSEIEKNWWTDNWDDILTDAGLI